MDFTNQTVIVTGAGGNVGGAIARHLGGVGANLVLVDSHAESLQRTASDLPAGGQPLMLDGLDLRNEGDVERVVNEAVARFGRIDALANTVGTFRMGGIAGEAASQWNFLMELNAYSALLLCKAAAPAMAQNGYGRMLHVAAGAALRGSSDLAAYSASKAALMRVVEACAEEFRKSGVTANCILPTTIDTPQNRAAMPDADTSGWVKLEAIARAVALLLSKDAAAITGAAIPISGQG